MVKDSTKDITKWIRSKLNSLPEKDNQGNNYRVGWQILTYVAANVVESSSDPKIRLLGKSVKKGVKLSFIDLAAKKLSDWLDGNNNPYQLTKSCSFCGCVVNSWNNYCPNCFNKI